MPIYKVTKGFKGSRTGAVVEQFNEGDTVSLDGDLERIAINEKWVKLATPAEDVELSNDRLIQLLDAIDQLEDGNEDHWTQNKGPEVAALSKITGTTVKAVERDLAWKHHQENR